MQPINAHEPLTLRRLRRLRVERQGAGKSVRVGPEHRRRYRRRDGLGDVVDLNVQVGQDDVQAGIGQQRLPDPCLQSGFGTDVPLPPLRVFPPSPLLGGRRGCTADGTAAVTGKFGRYRRCYRRRHVVLSHVVHVLLQLEHIRKERRTHPILRKAVALFVLFGHFQCAFAMVNPIVDDGGHERFRERLLRRNGLLRGRRFRLHRHRHRSAVQPVLRVVAGDGRMQADGERRRLARSQSEDARAEIRDRNLMDRRPDVDGVAARTAAADATAAGAAAKCRATYAGAVHEAAAKAKSVAPPLAHQEHRRRLHTLDLERQGRVRVGQFDGTERLDRAGHVAQAGDGHAEVGGGGGAAAAAAAQVDLHRVSVSVEPRGRRW